LGEVSAPALGSIAIKEAVRRAGVAEDKIDEVILGNVVGAGLGQNVARQAAIGAGLPNSVGATTVNKVCGSGMKAVMLAAQAIQCGDARTIVAGGAESMSGAPYLLAKARSGYRLGNGEVVDAVIRDGLWDVYNNLHMGTFGDRCAAKENISRQEQDDFAVASYQRAIAAQKDKTFAAEIVDVEIKGRKGSTFVKEDEEPTRFNEEKLRALRPAFDPSGSVTAGNASSINDGAAAVVVIAPEQAKALGVQPQARILGYATYSRQPEWFTLAPVCVIEQLMKNLGLTVSDVDLFEVNEAFAVVTLATMKQLGIPHDKMNVHGGAVALGHPIGASGTRVLVTLLNAMKQRQARRGIASLCIGGGEAVALAVERV
jgi:acetyl-CoA C-acetyltransferase